MAVATIRLFHSNAYMRSFDATVLTCERSAGGWQVLLDATCFYPEGGGQPCDLGTLAGHRVLDVQDSGTGMVIHTLEAPAAGRVHGEIDWDRRLDHMEQHTGQHLLSGAFERLMGAETVSWHLGEESCTIDLAVDALEPDQVEAAEAECRRVICSLLPVSATLVEAADLAAIPLRKPPKVTEGIWVVEIAGYNWSACGGTHLRNVGELGLLRIKAVERYKRGIRVIFLAGQRAARDYGAVDRMTRDLSRSLSIGVQDLPLFVARVQEENAALRRQVRVLQERQLEAEAAELLGQGRTVRETRLVQMIFGGRPLDEVKLLAAKVAGHSRSVAIFGTRGAIPQIILHRSADVRLDLGAVLRQVLPLIEGRGGGSPIQAQGGGSRPDGLESALETAAVRIAEVLRQ